MKVKVKLVISVSLFATPWTVAYQVPPSTEFSRQEYWSGMPFPSPRYLPEPGIKPGCPALQANALLSEPPGKTVLSQDPNLGLFAFNIGEGNGNPLQYSLWTEEPDRLQSIGLQRVGHD